MFRQTSENRTRLLVLLCGLFVMAVALSPAVAGGDTESPASEPEATSSRAVTLPDLGLELDLYSVQSPAKYQDQYLELDKRVRAYLDGDHSKSEKKAARYLWAEVKLALGQYREAEDLFKKSEKDFKKGPYADDAAFLRVVAIESDGRDDEAAREWAKWIKRYGDSPLRPEALIGKCWNEIRRDSVRLASVTLAELQTKYSYAAQDIRVTLAAATISYLNGDPAAALATLGEKTGGAAHYYLRGLCYEQNGKILKAASQYQKVYQSYPDSPLRDRAMLAKANVFLSSGGYQSAAEEYTRVIESATDEDVQAEARVRRAACRFLGGDSEDSTELLRETVALYGGSVFAARAQLLLGEVLLSMGAYEEAIIEFNRVLTGYFEHELAASAQYRVGRCLDALSRRLEATSAYQLVVSGYPISPQAPAAAYLAGAGLLEQGRPLDAAPYFQLVLDRYADREEAGVLVFESPERQELVEASLCLLELSYHRAGDMGQLSGVPHLMLQKMPPSRSEWRAYTLLIDADAMAAQGRYDEAQASLETLIDDFGEHDVGLPANRLLAWTHAQQGNDDLAIKIEERMLARYGATAAADELSSAYINKAHILFNNKKYAEAATAYDDYYYRYPEHPDRQLALYQSGMCYSRLDQSGDAVDRWETAVELDPSSEVAERAWVRAGDLYFQAEYYEEATRCYQGLLDNFGDSRGTALGMLRLAQCEFNAGNDAAALQLYSQVIARFPGTGIAREAEKGMEVALYRLGQSDDGGQVLTELVEQYPNSAFAADAQFEVAMRHYDAREFEAAAEEFRRVVSQFPSYSAADRAHFLMAESFHETGNTREAKNGYEQFLMFFPDSEFETTVRFKLGAIRFAEGDYMQAAVEFSTVIESEATEEILKASLFNLALCQKMTGNFDEAVVAFNSYRQKYPADGQVSEAAYMLGEIHEQAGDFEAARKEFKTALQAKPARELRLELYYRIGICSEELGDIDDAIANYEKASKSKLKSDVFRLSAVIRCAALYEQKGEYKKAIVAYRDMVKNAEDSELVAAAQERVTQLESIVE